MNILYIFSLVGMLFSGESPIGIIFKIEILAITSLIDANFHPKIRLAFSWIKSRSILNP